MTRVAMRGRPSLDWSAVCSGTSFVVLDVEVNLRVQLGRVDWQALPSPNDSVARFLQQLHLEDGSISVIELLAEVVAWRPRTGAFKSMLLGQVSLQIAIAVDEVCLARLGEPAHSSGALSVRQRVFDARTDSLGDISKELVRYWQVAEEKFRCLPKHLSLASDKSRVLGLTLMSTVFVGPGNFGAWAFPAALFGGWAAPQHRVAMASGHHSLMPESSPAVVPARPPEREFPGGDVGVIYGPRGIWSAWGFSKKKGVRYPSVTIWTLHTDHI